MNRTHEPLAPRQRRTAVAVALSVAAAFALAAYLTPDVRGYGTHEQLGLAPCPSLAYFTVPCPFCGMTTAWAHMIRGHVAEGVQTNPAGAALFCIAAAGGIVALIQAVSGRQWQVTSTAVSRLVPYLGAILLASWIYKVVEICL